MRVWWALIGTLFTLLLAAPARVDAGAAKWWQDASVQQRLNLAPWQVTALEHEFQSTLAERRALRDTLDTLQAQLDHAIETLDVEDAVILDLIDRVTEATVKRNRARIVLLLHLRQILTPPQRVEIDRLAGEVRSPARRDLILP